MFTLKHKKMLGLIAFCSLLFTSCYPSGGELLSTEDNAAISNQIENIVSNNEDLDVEVTLPAESVAELPKINVKIMEWDEDQLKNVFLSGKENLVHEEHTCELFTDEKQHVYYTAEDAEGDERYAFNYQPMDLVSQSSGSGVFGYGTLRTYLGYAHLEDIFTDSDISLLSKDDAIERCTDILKSVGITNYSDPDVYAVTVDKANIFWKEQMYTDYEEYKDWSSAEEEVYIMRFPLKYGDINAATSDPNFCANYGPVGVFVGSYVNFVVTKDGIHSLDARNIFSPEYEAGDTVKINCSAEKALKIAAEHYDSVSINDVKYKIFDCSLVYVPHDQYDEKNFTLVPMWEIEAAYYRDDDTIGTYDNLYIDAEAGNIIIW
ncbi:MAG: hypothetical protein NC203_03720 [Firmicutes bacterium]|nr:hypothetical protein [[Eubacterium] siraeum]MCM1487455.1 hypothetical protein [Bacillota bacterium]